MIFKIELEAYMKRKFMLENNIQKSYSLVLVQFIELLKRRIKHSKGWIKASTKFDILRLIKVIKCVILRFEDYKYIHILVHQENINFYTLHQGNISNTDYLEKYNNLVDTTYVIKGRLHDQ